MPAMVIMLMVLCISANYIHVWLNEVMIQKFIRICHCLQKNRACKTTVWTIAKKKGKKKEDETRVDKQVFLSSVIQTTISRLSYIFPEWTNSRILEQFEHSPDILTTFHNQTNFDKKLFFFVFLPTKRGLSLLTCYSMQCPEHCPLNTTNNRFFIRVLYTSTYQQLCTKKVPRYKKKAIFWEFTGILESFWRILDISKGILQLFSGNSGKNFRLYFRNYVTNAERPIRFSWSRDQLSVNTKTVRFWKRLVARAERAY